MLVRTFTMLVVTAALLVPVGGVAPASATPDNFTPRSGVTFNSPLGGRKKQKSIFRKIVRSINSTPKGGEINVFTWNFLTREGKEALMRAKRRGVRVRLLMDDENIILPNGDRNGSYLRLKAGLKRGNKQRRPSRRSWARVCQSTCRGGGGAAHSKFFTFSKAGKARQVVMQGSANLTKASTTNQWNDLYTHRGNRAVYRFATRIFREASRDKRARDVFATKNFSNFRLMFFPNTGKHSPDPVMQMLRKVKCKGARNTRHGRTVIRMSPDVLRNARGMRIAKRTRYLWRRGCDIHLGYTVVGIDIGRYLRARGHRRGPVPMKHLVQDYNGDGRFDNYFHLKSMTIRGHYGRSRRGHAVLNGSANWSGLGMISDENVGIYRGAGTLRSYQQHLDYWWYNFPRSRTSRGRLVFGAGQDAVYEDGTPVSTDGTDPFEKLELD